MEDAAQIQSATRDPVPAADVPRLLEGVSELRVARGKKIVRVDLTAPDRPGDDEIVAMVTSRWGKLRAPSLRVGTTLAVGFNREMLESVFRVGGR